MIDSIMDAFVSGKCTYDECMKMLEDALSKLICSEIEQETVSGGDNMTYDDICYECGGYGDDYYYDENGDLVCACGECWVTKLMDDEGND